MKKIFTLTLALVLSLVIVTSAFAAVSTERGQTVIHKSSSEYTNSEVVHRIVSGSVWYNTPDLSFWEKFTDGPYMWIYNNRLNPADFTDEEIAYMDTLFFDHGKSRPNVNIFIDLNSQTVDIYNWLPNIGDDWHGYQRQFNEFYVDYQEVETETVTTYEYLDPYTVIEHTVNLITTVDHIYQLVAWGCESPIILDLDNNNRVDVAEGRWLPHLPRVYTQFVRKFDMTGSGTRDLTEWMTPNPGDGLLVMPNAEGKVETALELFGTAGGFDDGYHKLATLCDRDNNGWVEGEELEGLKIWIDHNNNAICEPGELYSLDKFNIARISVNHENFKSVYETTDGQVRTTWDWWPSVMEVRKLRKR